MNHDPDDICAHGEYCKKTDEAASERYTAKPVSKRYFPSNLRVWYQQNDLTFLMTSQDPGRDLSSATEGKSSFVKPWSKISVPLSKTDETFRVVQSVLLAFAILVLSYHGIRYGRTEFSLLDNGRVANGFISHNRAAVTLNLGYSPAYSAASSIVALMLLYSLLSKKPTWSLPSVIFCLADLIYEIGDAAVATWLFFGNLYFTTALLYTTGTIFVVRTSTEQYAQILWYCGKKNLTNYSRRILDLAGSPAALRTSYLYLKLLRKDPTPQN